MDAAFRRVNIMFSDLFSGAHNYPTKTARQIFPSVRESARCVNCQTSERERGEKGWEEFQHRKMVESQENDRDAMKFSFSVRASSLNLYP